MALLLALLADALGAQVAQHEFLNLACDSHGKGVRGEHVLGYFEARQTSILAKRAYFITVHLLARCCNHPRHDALAQHVVLHTHHGHV